MNVKDQARAKSAAIKLKIVHLVDVERKTFSEVSALTKKPVQAVGSLYCRAKLEGLE